MRKVRVVVEVSVPDNHPLTEHDLSHLVKRQLRIDRYSMYHRDELYLKDNKKRRFYVKELRRVLEYLPRGKRHE